MEQTLRRIKVNSTPPRRIRKLIGDTSLTLRDAVAEIVANSLDARENDDERITVDVCLDQAQVLILDNAAGMTEKVLAEAIRLGVDMGKVLGREEHRMGYFGLGMKTACASIGDWWSIVTRPQGGGEELVVEFDLLRDESDSHPSLWEDEIVIREPDPDGPLGDRPCGTAVVIERLHDRNPMQGSVVSRLGEAFKGYLEQGDMITVNGTPCSPPVWRLIPGSRIEFRFPLDDGDPSKVVSGWLGLHHVVNTRGDRGFNIYRRGQLIQAWNQDWYRYHPTSSYLLGDVHLDFIRANFFKQGMQRQSEEWVKVSRLMKDYLKPAVAAARKVRRGITSAELLEIVNTMRGELGYPPYVPAGGSSARGPGEGGEPSDARGAGDTSDGGAPDDSNGSGGAGDSGDSPAPPRPPIRVSLNSLVLSDGQVIALDFAEEELDTETMPWDYMSPPGRDQLLAVANTKSELYRQLRDPRLLLALAVSDAIVQFLIEQKHKPADEARSVRNQWLHKFLVSKEVRL
jgi:hypothetical protein